MRRYSRKQIREQAETLINDHKLQVPVDLEFLVKDLGGEIHDTHGTDEPEGYVKLIQGDPARKFEMASIARCRKNGKDSPLLMKSVTIFSISKTLIRIIH